MAIVCVLELATKISIRLSLLKSPSATDRGGELDIIELFPMRLNVQ
jgi:hypothetical protein